MTASQAIEAHQAASAVARIAIQVQVIAIQVRHHLARQIRGATMSTTRLHHEIDASDEQLIAGRLTVSVRERDRQRIKAQTEIYLQEGKTITHLPPDASTGFGGWEDVDEDLATWREKNADKDKKKKCREKWNNSITNKEADKPNRKH